MSSGIYSIKNIQNNKIYIGSSIAIERRWKEHLNKLRLNKHENRRLQNSWNKYGEEAFKFNILEIVEPTKDLILSREQFFIDQYKSYDKLFGFNLFKIAGSPQGTLWTEEQKANLSEVRNKQYETQVGPMTGKKHSFETKEAMRNTHKNLQAKLRAEGKQAPQKGVFTWSEEAKQRMSETRKGKKYPKEFGEAIRQRRLGSKRVNGHMVYPGDADYPVEKKDLDK